MDNGYGYDSGLTRARPVRRRRRVKPRFIGFCLVLITVFFGAMACGFYLAQNQIAQLISAGMNYVQLPFLGPKQMNILLLGVDQREKEHARADTIMVAFVDLKAPQVKILSVPRDTYVAIPGHGSTKINHAHAYGGAELVRETAEDLLGVPIDRYLELNFVSFKEIIDTLGGIQIDVEKRMDYPPEDINLKPGLQVLNGYDALGYVRYRGDAMADISRIGRQQKFLLAVVDQALKPENILKIPAVVEKVSGNLHTNLTPQEMLAMGQTMSSLSSSQVEGQMIPGTPARIGGVDYWNPDQEKLRTIVNNIINPGTDAGKAHAAQ